MEIATLTKRELLDAFRKDLGHLLQQPESTEVLKWIWENLVANNQEALKERMEQIKNLQRIRNDREATLKAFFWNVHEIRKNGSTLFAFHGDKFCKGQSVDELLEAYHEQTKET